MLEITNSIIKWTKEYLNRFGEDTKIIVNITGGKDSAVTAALCVNAAGKDRVVGVILPRGQQRDIKYCYKLVHFLGIRHFDMNVAGIYDELMSSLTHSGFTHEDITTNNQFHVDAAARVRMLAECEIADLVGNCKIANISNRSELYVGHVSKFGDTLGDFNLLGSLTATEVMIIGDDLKLPKEIVHKKPENSVYGKPDEDIFGFSYAELDGYLLNGIMPKEQSTYEKIAVMHMNAKEKLDKLEMFQK